MISRIKQLAAQHLPETVAVRRHLHAHPELSFQETETSAFVCAKLDEWGIAYKAGYVKTGIVAHIHGKHPESKVIALRADLDALPITEANDVPYCSTNKGVMHACGHDVHTACLLGAARILHDIRDEWSGTVKLVFQPGEERLPGGASLMIKEGALDTPPASAIFGQHVFPDLEVGKVGFRPGMYMASTDELYMTVLGKGGHAALPHTLIDPVLITAHILTSLQQVVSRRAKPGVPSVLSFGKMVANGATNIIPDKVELEGTFRTMDEEWRSEAHRIMMETAENVARGFGGRCELRIDRGYPFLVNDETLTAQAQQAARDFLGAENVVDLEMRMTAEDFSYYSQLMPACFYRLGTRNSQRGITSGLHTSTFDVDEGSLEIGAGLMAWLAVEQLRQS
jgi:amidohydrolase